MSEGGLLGLWRLLNVAVCLSVFPSLWPCLYPCWQPGARVLVAAFWHLATKWCMRLDTHAKIWQIGLTRQLTGGGTPDDIDTADDDDVINENVC